MATSLPVGLVLGEHDATAAAGAEFPLLGEPRKLPGSHGYLQDSCGQASRVRSSHVDRAAGEASVGYPSVRNVPARRSRVGSLAARPCEQDLGHFRRDCAPSSVVCVDLGPTSKDDDPDKGGKP